VWNDRSQHQTGEQRARQPLQARHLVPPDIVL
jgi:hypothetical protein